MAILGFFSELSFQDNEICTNILILKNQVGNFIVKCFS